jgi:hypothetical protein
MEGSATPPPFFTIKLHISARCINIDQLPVNSIIQACTNRTYKQSSRQTAPTICIHMHVLWQGRYLTRSYLDLAFPHLEALSFSRSCSSSCDEHTQRRQRMARLHQAEQEVIPYGSNSPFVPIAAMLSMAKSGVCNVFACQGVDG